MNPNLFSHKIGCFAGYLALVAWSLFAQAASIDSPVGLWKMIEPVHLVH